MHSCFAIVEIVEEIVNQVDVRPLQAYSNIGRTGLDALVCLARTSTAFYLPAVKRIWCRQVGLTPLFKCLPDEIWEGYQKFGDTHIYKLSRPPTASEWKRFDFHASFVKEYEAYMDEEDSSPRLLEVLASRTLGQGRLFPDLRCLTWGSEDWNFKYAWIFLGPKLVDIHVEMGYANELKDINVGFIEAMHQACPGLQNLHVNGGPEHEMSRPISVAVPDFSRLQTLSAEFVLISDDAWAYLGKLPSLTKLSCVLSAGVTASLRALDSRTCFPRLQAMDVTFPELNASALSRLYLMRRARKVWIRIRGILTGEQLRTALQTFCGPALDMFVLWTQSQAFVENANIHRGALEPLALAHNIKVLRIHANTFSLSDLDIADLVSHMGSLVELSLAPHGSARPKPINTLASLASVVAHCKQLVRLEMEFDVTVPPTLVPPTDVLLSSVLTQLHVCDSHLEDGDADAEAVASFLSLILPRTIEIKPSRLNRTQWNRVSELLREVGDVHTTARLL